MKNQSLLSTIVLLAAIALMIMLYLNKCSTDHQDSKDKDELITALQDSLHTSRLPDSSMLATITVIKTESAKDFLNLQIKDSLIKELQSVVKEYKSKLKPGGSVTKGDIETDIVTDHKTVITRSDTIRKDSLVYIYPEYRDTLKNKWINYDIVQNKDSSKVRIGVNNDFSIVIGQDKGKPFADLHTENPYSTVKDFRVFQVSTPRPKKIGIGPSVGYGISSGFKPEVFIGISIQYNLIRL